MYKTVGGGHCIQFTEVETLKTRSDELTSPGRLVGFLSCDGSEKI